MRYSKQKFGEELIVELDRGYDPERIAKWCYERYLDERDRDHDLDDVMDEIFGMDAGPEFEIPEVELRRIASSLVDANEDMSEAND